MEYKCIDYTNYFLRILHCVAESEPIYGVLPINDLPDAQRSFKDTVFRMLFRKTMELKVAVNKAVDDCIKEGILEDFLREQRAEVIAMSIYEYDQEMHMRVVKEESWEDGQNKMLLLVQHMQDNNELHLLDMLEDKNFLQQMYDKYSL